MPSVIYGSDAVVTHVLIPAVLLVVNWAFPLSQNMSVQKLDKT